jgi:hypothetical protein
LSLVSTQVQAFGRLSLDNDKKVREAIYRAFAPLTAGAAHKKHLASHLRALFPHWYMHQHDPFREVARAARDLFEATFPVARRRDVLVFCKADFLGAALDNLQQTAATLSDLRTCTQDEADERLERVVSSTLAAMGAFMEMLAPPAAAVPASLPSSSASSAASSSTTPAPGLTDAEFAQLVSDRVLKFAASDTPVIRRSVYALLKSVLLRAPALARAELARLATPVFAAVADKDAACHAHMWELLLVLARDYPQCWHAVNVSKHFFPRLWATLRHGGHGSPKHVYPCLLPLLSCIPDTLFAAPASGDGKASADRDEGKKKEKKGGAAAALSFFASAAAVDESAASSSSSALSESSSAAAATAAPDVQKQTAALFAFLEKFTENIWLGLSAPLLGPDGARALLSAYCECAQHCVQRLCAAALRPHTPVSEVASSSASAASSASDESAHAEVAAQVQQVLARFLSAQTAPLLESLLLCPPAHVLISASARSGAAAASGQSADADDTMESTAVNDDSSAASAASAAAASVEWKLHPLATAAVFAKLPIDFLIGELGRRFAALASPHARHPSAASAASAVSSSLPLVQSSAARSAKDAVISRAACSLLSDTLARVLAALPRHDDAALVAQRIAVFFDSSNGSNSSSSSSSSNSGSAWLCVATAEDHASETSATASGKHGIGAVVLRAALTLLRESEGGVAHDAAEQLFQCVAIRPCISIAFQVTHLLPCCLEFYQIHIQVLDSQSSLMFVFSCCADWLIKLWASLACEARALNYPMRPIRLLPPLSSWPSARISSPFGAHTIWARRLCNGRPHRSMRGLNCLSAPPPNLFALHHLMVLAIVMVTPIPRPVHLPALLPKWSAFCASWRIPMRRSAWRTGSLTRCRIALSDSATDPCSTCWWAPIALTMNTRLR